MINYEDMLTWVYSVHNTKVFTSTLTLVVQQQGAIFDSIFNLVYYWLEFIFFQHLNKFTISDSVQDCFMHGRDSKIMPKLYIQPFFYPDMIP